MTAASQPPAPHPGPEPLVSIIIPAWNEAAALPRTLDSARTQNPPPEILLVDAASSDDTPHIAAQHGARVIHSPIRQRAAQMNLGATHARGGNLLFLHGDTLLPPGALESLLRTLADPRIPGGAFTRIFAPASHFLQAAALLTRLRNHTLGWHLGDQAIFARRSAFDSLGGFMQIDRFEDLDFSRRLARLGPLATLHPPVITSARRFDRLGPARQTMRDFLLTLRYLTGNRAVCFKNGRAPELANIDAHAKPS